MITLDPHETIDGVWEHRASGEQMIKITRWSPLPGSDMPQRDTWRLLPVVHRLEGDN